MLQPAVDLHPVAISLYPSKSPQSLRLRFDRSDPTYLRTAMRAGTPLGSRGVCPTYTTPAESSRRPALSYLPEPQGPEEHACWHTSA